jgi:hypothetical protein
VGECGGKWETKIMLINGGAVCCRECNLDSAAPIGRIRESANAYKIRIRPPHTRRGKFKYPPICGEDSEHMWEVQIFPHIPENLAFGAGNLKYAKSGSWVIRDRFAIRRITWTANM